MQTAAAEQQLTPTNAHRKLTPWATYKTFTQHLQTLRALQTTHAPAT